MTGGEINFVESFLILLYNEICLKPLPHSHSTTR